MKLKKRSLFNTKLSYLVVMVFLMLGSMTPGYALNYHYEENFSDSQLDSWKFSQVDFSTSAITVTTDHTFVLENGELISTGGLVTTKENAAFTQDNTAFGGWSFDLYLPSSLTLSQDHQIMMSREELGYETFHAIFSLHIERDSLNLRTANGTNNHDHDNGITTSVSEMEYDIYQHYDLIRTVDRFYVFIDKMMALNMTFELNLDTSINYFGLVATQGSNARFDNIQITTDATGLLNEILNPNSSSSGGGASSETSSSDKTQFLTLGLGSIALIGGAFFWRRLQNRRIAKLVKINSNMN